MPNFLGETDTAWWDIVGKFRAKAREFWACYEKLKAIDTSNYPADMREEHQKLLRRYETTRETVEKVTRAIDAVVNFFSFGSDDNLSGQQMGVLPIIPIAVIASALTAMGYILADTVKFFKRKAIYDDAIASGSSPSQAADIMSKSSGNLFSELSTIAKVIGVSILGVIVLPKIMK